MALSLAVGLYFLFAYWENKRLPALVLSFVSFFVAFLFTQKILTVWHRSVLFFCWQTVGKKIVSPICGMLCLFL